jgi:hypothetical protein
MKNFEEDNDYIQKIIIINDPLPSETKVSTGYDLQLLPEGGHFIEDTEITVGVRLTDYNGRGVKIEKGQIFNNEGLLITEVHLNDSGIGKFNFFYRGTETYTLKTTLEDGAIMEKRIPAPKKMGVVLSINNILEDKLVVVVKTNEATLAKINGDEFHLAVHRDGLMTLKSFKIKESLQIIKIPKNKLLSGTNIVTLFNKELKPICERLIFNYNDLNLAKLNIKTPVRKNKDSIAIKINTFSKRNMPMALSVSILPATSIARGTNTNIINDFLLKPYLQSSIENPKQFFENIDRNKEYGLDLALLTQGWSSYDWDNIFKGKPEIKYPFENGISAMGTIKSKVRKGDELVIDQGDITNMLFVKLNDSIDFRISDFMKPNKDTLLLALRNKNGKLRKPEFDIIFESDLNDIDSISKKNKEQIDLNFEEIGKDSGLSISPKNLIWQENTVFLDEVIVSEAKIEKKLTRASPLINDSFKGVKIGEKELRQNPTLTQLINKNGFRVINDLANNIFTIINTRPGSGPVRVYIDDFLTRNIDIKRIAETPLNQYDEIYFERDGLAGDVNAPGGVIRIYSKLDGRNKSPINSSFAEKLVENSFTRPKKFYRPKYALPLNESFEKYGVVHWEPNLTTNKKGEAVFTIPDDGLQQIKLFIEGMGEDGTLLSYSGLLNLN